MCRDHDNIRFGMSSANHNITYPGFSNAAKTFVTISDLASLFIGRPWQEVRQKRHYVERFRMAFFYFYPSQNNA
jgi:hypothetical protein